MSAMGGKRTFVGRVGVPECGTDRAKRVRGASVVRTRAQDLRHVPRLIAAIPTTEGPALACRNELMLFGQCANPIRHTEVLIGDQDRLSDDLTSRGCAPISCPSEKLPRYIAGGRLQRRQPWLTSSPGLAKALRWESGLL
jgi:hypothetical protein